MRALLLANRDDADPGFVGARLRDLGYTFTECHREHPGAWPSLEGVDLVLSLGSDWSVYWDHVRPSVAAEAELVRRAHRRGVPVLGICFGGQIMATALGGSVEQAPQPEVGWHLVSSATPELAGSGPWFQWHADRFTVPPGAEPLAASPLADQAFRLGRTVALQFHPEVDACIVTRWAAGGMAELTALGIDPVGLVERTRTEVARSEGDAFALVDWFVTYIAAGAAAPP